ncbi:hypothetical protein L1987_43012 [Smallanthus sonchifolius]|uniref:Uncharacterized protein n=1 Tax=Smallanthus sonchifolius TaxID=185202 RepID=A0ACB9GL52_9ASTR|nr:hypothetical protein L1987_43012 [Smallanthus sonchifolius]
MVYTGYNHGGQSTVPCHRIQLHSHSGIQPTQYHPFEDNWGHEGHMCGSNCSGHDVDSNLDNWQINTPSTLMPSAEEIETFYLNLTMEEESDEEPQYYPPAFVDPYVFPASENPEDYAPYEPMGQADPYSNVYNDIVMRVRDPPC